jgi:hypothetical protein
VAPTSSRGLTAYGLRIAGGAAAIDKAPPTSSSPYGDFVFGDKIIPRATEPPVALNGPQMALVKAGLAALDRAMFGVKDWRSEAEALETLKRPLAKTGSPQPFGPLSLMVPGGANYPGSAAALFRAAQYSGRVVMAYQNLTDPKMNELREVKAGEMIEGVPLPAKLADKHKVFAVGSPEPCLAGLEQSADNLLFTLAQMVKQKDLLGVDPLEVGATVIGHSEGAAAVVVAAEKAHEAGVGQLFGKVVSLGGGIGVAADPELRDQPAPPVIQAGILGVPVLKALGDQPAFSAVANFVADYKKLMPLGADQLVDLSIAGVVGGPPKVHLKFGFPPFELEDPNNVRPGIRAFIAGAVALGDSISVDHLTGSSWDGDGLVPTEYSRGGKEFVVLEGYDHVRLAGDSNVMDVIAQHLSPPTG